MLLRHLQLDPGIGVTSTVNVSAVKNEISVDLLLLQATKKCCSDERDGVPIIWPRNRNNLTEAEMRQVKWISVRIDSREIISFKLDKTVSLLAPLFMDSLVCDGLDYKTMLRLDNCQDFTTTTTERPNKLSQTDSSGSLRGFMGMVLLSAIMAS